MKVRRISLTTRIFIINIIVLLAATSILGYVSIRQSKTTMEHLIKQRMLDIANSAASMLDGDVMETLTAEDEETEAYQSQIDELAVFRDNTELEYIYCMKADGDKKFTFTIDATIEDPAEFGAEAEYTDALYNASKGNADVDAEAYEDEWGKHYTAYSPVFNSSKQVVGIVGVDFSAEWFDSQITKHIRTIMIITIVILILSVGVVLILISNVKHGFTTLNAKLCDIADGSGDLSKEIYITSGDEFEVLGHG